MPSPQIPTPITLIVATTPTPSSRLGIGLNGTLPWPRIKSDMSFFARVTARPPPPASTLGTAVPTNAVIMGRKTYDSIPAELRPLGKRVNVVVSRDVGGGVSERVREELKGKLERERELAEAKRVKAEAEGTSTPAGGELKEKREGTTDAFVSSSLDDALNKLDKGAEEGSVGHVYVIGGAEIYSSSLRLGSESGPAPASDARKVRIIMTDVEKLDGSGFDCDTFFPIDAKELSGGHWRTVPPAEVTSWVGEEVTGEWIVEGDVRVRMVGYETVESS